MGEQGRRGGAREGGGSITHLESGLQWKFSELGVVLDGAASVDWVGAVPVRLELDFRFEQCVLAETGGQDFHETVPVEAFGG